MTPRVTELVQILPAMVPTDSQSVLNSRKKRLWDQNPSWAQLSQDTDVLQDLLCLKGTPSRAGGGTSPCRHGARTASRLPMGFHSALEVMDIWVGERLPAVAASVVPG